MKFYIFGGNSCHLLKYGKPMQLACARQTNKS